MSITISPAQKAFIEREIKAGSFRSEAEAVEMALSFFEQRLQRLRAAIREADDQIAAGASKSISADEHLKEIRKDGPPRR